jgi:cytochrome c2
MRRLTTWLAAAVLLSGCGSRGEMHQLHRAKRLIAEHCAACHEVPGIPTATGRVGPSLAHIASQQIIAGYLANTPERMNQWVGHPQKVLPGNAMPEMGLSPADVSSIVDYLYTLE